MENINKFLNKDIKNMKNTFLQLAQESFNNEQKLYKEIFKKPPISVEQLTRMYLQDLYNVIYDHISKQIFKGEKNTFLQSLFLNRKFYEELGERCIKKPSEERISKTLNEFNSFLQNNIRKKGNWETELSVLISLLVEDLMKSSNRKISNLHIKTKGNNNQTFYIEFEEDGRTIIPRQQFTVEFAKRGIGILWNKNTTKDFVEFLEKSTKATMYSDQNNYYLLDPNITSDFLDAFIFQILTLQEKFPEGIKDLYAWIKSNYNFINNLLNNDKNIQLLLKSKQDLNSLKGSLGEIITRIIIESFFRNSNNNNNNKNTGQLNMGTGEMAVDLYIKNMGFQVKNYPSKISDTNILLYHQSNLLCQNIITKNKNEGTKQWKLNTKNLRGDSDLKGNRYMNKTSWEYLARPFTKPEVLEDSKEFSFSELYKILVSAFPNYIRYSENIVRQEIVDSELAKIRNNFFIVNYHVIPSSAIFYLLSQSSTFKNNPIDSYFYYSSERSTDAFANHERLIEKEKNKKLQQSLNNLVANKDSLSQVYFVFKGINIFNGKKEELKLNNLLSM